MLNENNKFTQIISWRYINSGQIFGYRNFIYLNFRNSTMSSKSQPEWHVPENKEPLPTLKLYNSLTRSKVIVNSQDLIEYLIKCMKNFIYLFKKFFIENRLISFQKKEDK